MNSEHLPLSPATIDEIERRAHALLDGHKFSIVTCSFMTDLIKDQHLCYRVGEINPPDPSDLEKGARQKGGIIVYPDRTHIIFNVTYGVFGVAEHDKAEFFFSENLMVITLVSGAGIICNWMFMVEDHGG